MEEIEKNKKLMATGAIPLNEEYISVDRKKICKQIKDEIELIKEESL